MLWLILGIVILLYRKSIRFNYVVDDFVKRDGYLYDIPVEGPSQVFWERRPSAWYRIFMIGMHCVNVSIVFLLWGFAPALLFAVHPLSVYATAWVTGNYYGTTAFFCLIAYYFLKTFTWGAAVAVPVFTAALNSTITAVAFPFVMLAVPFGWTLFFPLATFLTGKRFKTGIKIRKNLTKELKVQMPWSLCRLVLMVKVVGRYIADFFFPNQLGFFPNWGKDLWFHQDRYDELQKVNVEFWKSFIICGLTLGIGLAVNPFMTLWFFVLIGVHSQWKILGQFYAQRYMYLPMVGLCAIAGSVLMQYPVALAVAATFLTIRTVFFIPAFRNQESLWRNDLDSFPDNSHAYSNLAQYLISKFGGKFRSALEMYEVAFLMNRAVSMDPKNYEIHMNMAAYYMAAGQPRLSLYHTEKAIEFVKDLRIPGKVEDLRGQAERIKKFITPKEEGHEKTRSIESERDCYSERRSAGLGAIA